MIKPRELVVARYNEDISWSEIFKGYRTVYNKGEKIEGVECITLPNVGRESHTYLYHIIHNWDNLAEKTMFCQGSLLKHGLLPKDIEKYFETPGLFKTGKFFRDSNWGYINHIGKWAQEKSSGKMQEAELSLGEWFDRIIQVPRGKYFYFKAGANFCVSKEAIKNRPRSFYEYLIRRVSGHVNPEEGHYLERAWLYIFCPSTKNPLSAGES